MNDAFRGYDQWKTASPYDTPEGYDYTEEFERAYGRVDHGLCGKDADLDSCGQLPVLFAGIIEDEAVLITKPYASVCGDDGWTEDQWDLATEIVCDGHPITGGEWDGDYWVLSTEKITVKVPLTNNDGAECDTFEGVSSKTWEALYAATFEAAADFQREIRYIHEAFNQIT